MTATRWGILGTGAVASAFAEELVHSPGAQLCAVASQSADRAARFAARFASRFDGVRPLDRHAAIFEDSDLDVVYIASPPAEHLGHATMGIDAGRAVLVEKPFTLNRSQAEAVLDRARASQVFCMEAMWMRFNPTIGRVKAILDRGEIGDVISIEASLGFPIASAERDHRLDPDKGGGALLDLGVYPISLAVHLLGPPSELESMARFGGTGVDTHSVTVLRFDNGALASVTSGFTALRNEVFIQGTDGAIKIHPPMLMPKRYSVHRGRTVLTDRLPGLGHLPGWSQVERTARLVDRLVETRPVTTPLIGRGYHYQATEVSECLQRGATESEVMSWDDTTIVMDTLDQVRSRWERQDLEDRQ